MDPKINDYTNEWNRYKKHHIWSDDLAGLNLYHSEKDTARLVRGWFCDNIKKLITPTHFTVNTPSTYIKRCDKIKDYYNICIYTKNFVVIDNYKSLYKKYDEIEPQKLSTMY